MNKLLLLTASSCLLWVQTSIAQHFTQGFGVGGYTSEVSDRLIYMNYFGLTYSPSFHFAEREKSSFSVGIPVTVGIGGPDHYLRGSDFGDDEITGVFVHVPVIVNFNWGAGATKPNNQQF